jgi:hypothetical protein
MKLLQGTLPSCLAICLLAGGLRTQEASDYTTDLKYSAAKNFSVILPKETWTPVQGIPIPHAGGKGFATDKDGLALSIDSDGDGRLDKKVKGAGGYVVLRGKRANGAPFKYAVRIRLAGRAYEFASSGAMIGSVYNVPLQIIDQNNNGLYNEYGIDAMVVGKGHAASYLSQIVNLKGLLYHFEVSADGSSATVKPYGGESGILSVRRGLSLPGKLLSAVVSETTKPISFQIANTQKGMRVPTGSYAFTGGLANKGGDTARLRAGKMKALVVEADETCSLKWGAPLMAEFDYTRDGPKVTVQPEVMFLGQAGEEWHTLLPDAKSPKLAFVDKDSNKILATKRFQGC